MALQTIYPQDNASNYAYDNEKIEYTGGLSKLLAIVTPGTAYMYAKLDENQGLVAIDSTGNGRHGAFQGGLDEGDWVTGKINSAVEGIGTTSGFINFDGAGNFERTQAFSLECWIKFTSSVTQSIISKQKNTGNFEGYAVNLSAGKIRFVIRDDLGNIISLESNSTYDDGNFHHVVCTYDGSSGDSGCKLYVDNSLAFTVTTPGTLTSTLINTADLQVSGRDGNNITLAVGSVVDEVAIYDRELNAADVAFRWDGGSGTQILPGGSTTFPTDDPPTKPRSSITVTEITSFSATINATGSDEVRIIIEKNGIDKYWDGANWVDSDGTLSQSNTESEVNTNIASLIGLSEGNVPVNWKALFHSADGSTTPELLEVDWEYDIAGIPDDVEECVVWAENLDSEGNPDTSSIEIQLNRDAVKYKNETVIRDDEITVIPDENTGIWEISLVENDNMDGTTYYKFTFNKTTYKKIVPNETRKNFWDLVDA